MNGDPQIGSRKILCPDLLTGELRGEGQVLQQVRAVAGRELQAAHIQIAALGIEPFPGLFICIRECRVRDGHFRRGQRGECPVGLGERVDVQLAVAVPFNEYRKPLQFDLVGPDLFTEQRQEFDPKVDLSR